MGAVIDFAIPALLLGIILTAAADIYYFFWQGREASLRKYIWLFTICNFASSTALLALVSPHFAASIGLAAAIWSPIIMRVSRARGLTP